MATLSQPALIEAITKAAKEGTPPALWGATVGLEQEALEARVSASPALTQAWTFCVQVAEAQVVKKLLEGSLKESTATFILRTYFDRAPVSNRDAPNGRSAFEEEVEAVHPFSQRE